MKLTSRFLNRRRWTLSVLSLLSAGLLMGCSSDKAPVSTFVLLDGSRLNTEQLQGKVALINFWATSCTTCVAEMPELISTYKQFKDQVLRPLPWP